MFQNELYELFLLPVLSYIKLFTALRMGSCNVLSRFHITSASSWEGLGAPLIFLKKCPWEVEGYVDEFLLLVFS